MVCYLVKSGYCLSDSLLGTGPFEKYITIRKQSSGKRRPVFPLPRGFGRAACAAAAKPFYECTSARRTTRLPSGQMTWSTCERTRSHVSSGVRRLVCKEDSTDDWLSRKEGGKGPAIKNGRPYHIDFRVGVAHVAYDTTVFHAVQMLPCHYILISYKQRRVAEERCREAKVPTGFRSERGGSQVIGRGSSQVVSSVCGYEKGGAHCATALRPSCLVLRLSRTESRQGKALCSGKHAKVLMAHSSAEILTSYTKGSVTYFI